MTIDKNKFNPTDIILLIYYFIIGVFILITGIAGKLDRWWLYFGHHVIVFVVVIIFTQKFTSKKRNLWSFLRYFYPILIFGSAYRETHDIDQIFFRLPLDYYIAHWDEMLFGFQPSIEFATKFSWPWFSELMHMGYFSYFLLIPLIPIIWWLKKDYSMVSRRIFNVAFTFLLCYTIFIILPVQGPRVQLPGALNFPRTGYIFAPFFGWLFREMGIAGAAFPSSHCAVATVVLISSYLDFKKITPLTTVIVLLLYLSTVYGRFHYGVDVIYGAGFGTLFFILSNHVFDFLINRGFNGSKITSKELV